MQPLTVSKSEFSSIESIFKDSITDKSLIPDIETVVEIGGSSFAVKGDISVVGGLPKAGKTAISVYLLGTALKHIPPERDTLSIRSSTTKKPVVYIDTEQSTPITNKLRKSILNLIGDESQPENLHVFNLRKHPSASDKLRIVRSLFHHASQENNLLSDTHLWIIDGLADLVNNPNDTTECFGLIGEFLSIAERQQTTIIFYLHENPGSMQKLRGNLGSEIERKCFGAITVRKDREKGFHWIESRMLRGAADFQSIYFTYDSEIGRMRSLSETEKKEAEKSVDRTEIRLNQLKTLAEMATEHGKACPMNYDRIWRNVMDVNPKIYGRSIKERRAQDKVKEMLESGLLEKDEKGLYNLSKGDE